MTESLLGIFFPDLMKKMVERELEPWRAQQIWEWVYRKRVKSFDEMGNIPLKIRSFLADHFTLKRPDVVKHEISADYTEKWVIKLDDGEIVEMVLIPEKNRQSLCLSSQVGCAMHCAFCLTGTQKLARNLAAHEIVGQVLLAGDFVEDKGSSRTKRTLTNIVFMGMGEPLHNYEAVSKAINILMDPKGLAFSRRRITLSTSGVVPLLPKCAEDLGVNMAISLHAPSDDLRSQLMPINRQFPLSQLLEACRHYPGIHEARKMTFEYVLLKNVNDSVQQAKELARLLRGIAAKVNLIPWNPWPDAPFETSDPHQMEAFQTTLKKAGIQAFLRTPRGRDISAACGQLKTVQVPSHVRQPSD
jgi:23S rRNA (adenine2503-C2)-methyltransferase